MNPERRLLKRPPYCRGLAALCNGEGGSVAIETALAFMLVMTFILGIIECCMMTYVFGVYSDAARQGVRYAVTHGSDSSTCSGPTTGCVDPTGANVVSYVKAAAANYSAYITGMSVQVSYPDSSSTTPSRVAVTINYTYKPLFTFPGASHVFQVTSQGRILY